MRDKRRSAPRQRLAGFRANDAEMEFLERKAIRNGFIKSDGTANVSEFMRANLIRSGRFKENKKVV